jgi:hypothetical protein
VNNAGAEVEMIPLQRSQLAGPQPEGDSKNY